MSGGEGMGFDGFETPDYMRTENVFSDEPGSEASRKNGSIVPGTVSQSQSPSQVYNYESGEYTDSHDDDYRVSEIPASVPQIPKMQSTFPDSPAVPPNFTFPLNRGEGSNINARTIPADFVVNGEGDYQAGMPVSSGAYAGAEIKDYVNPSRFKYRDVNGQGGWSYRQFADGTIQILVSPQPKLLSTGTFIKNDPNSPAQKYWVAITNEIGTWAAFAKERNTAALKNAAAIAITAASAGKKSKGKKKKKVVVVNQPQTQLPDDDDKEESGIPTWAIALGGLVVVAGGVWLASRSSNNKEGKR